MTDEKTIARAIADYRNVAPDADTEFAVLTARLDGVDHCGGGRTAARAAAVVGLSAAVAVGSTLLLDGKGSTTGTTADGRSSVSTMSHPGRNASAHVAPALRQVAFSKRLVTKAGTDGIERPVISVGAGWLPGDAVLNGVGAGRDAGNGGEKRWIVPYADGPGGYTTSVSVVQGDNLPTSCFLCTTSQDLTVQGHPARRFESDPAFAENEVSVYIDLGDGQVANALTFYESAKLSNADAEDITDHVAREMTFDGHETVPVTARLTTAPAGDTIVSAYTQFGDDAGTVYQLNFVSDGAVIGIGGLAEKYPVTTGEPGRDVQGKPSVIIHDQDGRTGLYIKGLDGPYTKLYAGAGAETLDDLYLIADGIRPMR